MVTFTLALTVRESVDAILHFALPTPELKSCLYTQSPKEINVFSNWSQIIANQWRWTYFAVLIFFRKVSYFANIVSENEIEEFMYVVVGANYRRLHKQRLKIRYLYTMTSQCLASDFHL